MKKQFFILLFFAFLSSFSAFAQDETDGAGAGDIPKGHVLSVFAQDGAPFWLVLNGVKQSDKAGARVKVVGLKLGYYRARIVFQDESKAAIDTRIQLEGADPGFNHVVYVIRPSKLKKDKGMLVLAPDYFESIAKPRAKAAEVAKSTQDDEFPTYGYTTTTPEPMDEMGMEIFRKSMDMTTDIIRMGMEMEKNNPSIGQPTPPPNTSKKPGKKPKPVQVEETDEEPVATPKKKASNGCIVPMSQSKFSEALSLIKQESFSTDMVAAAKDLADAECLSCAQVVTVMAAMSHESDKVEFAKYAYNKVTDKKDFVRLINARLTFSGSKAEIRQFVQDNQ